MYAQTNRSLHHKGWSTSSQADLKADLLSSKASRGFHCKLMRCLLQCPCLSTDRALINQGNHKEIWERLCSKSPWDHKCTASKSVRPHYLSLSVSCCLSSYYFFSFCCASFWRRLLHFKDSHVDIDSIISSNRTSAYLHCRCECSSSFSGWLCQISNGARRQLNHPRMEEESGKHHALLLWPSTATCWICHFTMTP